MKQISVMILLISFREANMGMEGQRGCLVAYNGWWGGKHLTNLAYVIIEQTLMKKEANSKK